MQKDKVLLVIARKAKKSNRKITQSAFWVERGDVQELVQAANRAIMEKRKEIEIRREALSEGRYSIGVKGG